MKSNRLILVLLVLSLLACNFVTRPFERDAATVTPPVTPPTETPVAPLAPSYIPPGCESAPIATIPAVLLYSVFRPEGESA